MLTRASKRIVLIILAAIIVFAFIFFEIFVFKNPKYIICNCIISALVEKNNSLIFILLKIFNNNQSAILLYKISQAYYMVALLSFNYFKDKYKMELDTSDIKMLSNNILVWCSKSLIIRV